MLRDNTQLNLQCEKGGGLIVFNEPQTTTPRGRLRSNVWHLGRRKTRGEERVVAGCPGRITKG